MNHVVEKVRKTLSVRVAAAEVYRDKDSTVVDRTYVLASGAVLLLGPVCRRGKELFGTLSSVEERHLRSRGSPLTGAMDLDQMREYFFPLDAGGAFTAAGENSVDQSRAWPGFKICNQKKVDRRIPNTHKLSLFLEGTDSRRSDLKFPVRCERAKRVCAQRHWW